jgi:O-antigen ligase/polysaccharide polymerase Wzy-like membrane protein
MILSPAQSTTSNFFGTLLLGIALILMVFDTATQSLFNIIFFGDNALGPSLLICFCVIVFFAAIAILERDIYILTLFAVVIALLLFYYLYFIFGTNRPQNFNTLGSYYGWLMFIVFYVLAKHGLLPAAMKPLFFVYGAYLVMYLALVGLSDTALLSAIISKKFTFILTDEGRGTRIFMHSAAAAYVAMYSTAKLQEQIRLRYIATLGLASCALYFSFSRGLIICVGSIFLLYIITRRMKYVQYFSFIAYLLVAVYLSVGVFEPSFNPYLISKSDTSAVARAYEFQVAVPYIRQYPFFGIGLPDAQTGLTYYLGMGDINIDDLGIIGIWLTFGLVGVGIIGIGAVYLCCMQNLKRSTAVLGLTNARALSLIGCVLGLYAVMANNLLTSSGLLFSLIFANTLYNSRLFAAMRRTSRPVFARGQFRRLQPTPRRPPVVEPN